MRKKLDKKIELEQFEEFIFDMDDILDNFVENASASGYALDFSLKSLAILEKFLMTTPPQISESEKKRLLASASRYLGEVVLRCYGGKWQLNIEDEMDMNYGQYVVVGHDRYNLEFNPHSKIKMLLTGRPNGFLLGVVKNQINPTDIEAEPE